MPMPKAAVNKNDLSASPQDDIWATHDVRWVEAITITEPPQEPSYRDLRPCVLALNQRHLAATLALRQRVQSGHYGSAAGRVALSFAPGRGPPLSLVFELSATSREGQEPKRDSVRISLETARATHVLPRDPMSAGRAPAPGLWGAVRGAVHRANHDLSCPSESFRPSKTRNATLLPEPCRN